MADPNPPGATIAPSEHLAAPGAPDLRDSARRFGTYRWVELQLFEVLGGWVAAVPEHALKPLLAAHCQHHAWHAQLWRERFPEVHDLDADVSTKPANDRMVRFVEALREPAAPELSVEKLAGVYRVLLPRLVGAYTHLLETTNRLVDAPTVRTLELVLRDELDDWRDGELTLQELIDTPAAAERAARHQQRLERLIVEAGGVTGP